MSKTTNKFSPEVRERAVRLVLDNEPSQALTRDERAIHRLQDWLARPLWSGARNQIGPLPWPEGVCILAGIDPEVSADSDPAGWALFPGALAFYGFRSFPRDRHEAMQLGVAAKEHIGLLIGLGLITGKPDRWIDRVQREGIVIPWLGVAPAEAEARTLMQSNSLEGHAPIIVEKKQRSGRKVDASSVLHLTQDSRRRAAVALSADETLRHLPFPWPRRPR